MKILSSNNPAVQSKTGQDTAAESSRRLDSQKKDIGKNKQDSSSISNSRSASFEDNRVSTAKSAILYDVTVKESSRLGELKEAVKNGTYHVSTDALVDSLLK
ncbi:hypothetical protein ACIZ62_05250 [Acetobacterium carbinolicum]|uniref:hypothetical protein n=1 Tax=Acetobacterium carbinolicum TaxID=52690 RepID=UPI0039BF83F7